MKKVLYVLTGLVVLVVGALFIVPPMIANSVVKPRIAAAVEEATGRVVEIGDLGLSIFPSVSVSLKDLRLANAEGMPTPEMVSLGTLDLELQLFPLLGKSVLVDKLVVSDLAVFLEVNQEGQPNWVFEGRPAAQDENAGGEGAPLWDVRLGDVRLEGARLSYIDLTSGQTIQATDLNLKIALPSLSGKLTLDGGVTVNDQAIRLALAVDSPGSLMSGEPATIAAVVDSTLMALKSDLKLRQHPLPGLDGALSLEVASVGKLAAWLGQPLPEGQPDPGPLKVQVSLTADGEKLAVKSATINGKAAQATASGSFDGTGEIAKFDGKVHVAHIDLNAYLPPPSEEAVAPAGDKAQASQGWSEEPIDFSPLRQAEGNLIITTGPVLYREIKVQKIAATVNLAGGVLKATLQDLQLTPGQVTGGAVVDASGKAVAISYQISLDGVESKPFLKSFADIDWLSGKLTFQTKGTAKGVNQKQIVSTLNGDGVFKFLDGAFEGFDLAGTLRKAGSLGMSQEGEKPKTDFTELSGSYTITNGLFQNQDLKMLAPLVRMNGAGQANLPPRALDYRVEAKLVASMEGQGGQDALAGLPIPIHAHGPWDNLSYQVDWASVFQAAALDPSRIANMPTNLLDAAQNFGVALPIPGVGGEGGVAGAVGGALQGILGGGDKSSGGESSSPLQPLQNLLGGGKQTETQSTTQKGPQPTQQQQEQQQKQPSIVPDVGSILKKLF